MKSASRSWRCGAFPDACGATLPYSPVDPIASAHGIQGRATKAAIRSQTSTGMCGLWQSWRRNSRSTRSRHRWRSLGHQGGFPPSIASCWHLPHSGAPIPSMMYMLCSHAQHQSHCAQPREPILPQAPQKGEAKLGASWHQERSKWLSKTLGAEGLLQVVMMSDQKPPTGGHT